MIGEKQYSFSYILFKYANALEAWMLIISDFVGVAVGIGVGEGVAVGIGEGVIIGTAGGAAAGRVRGDNHCSSFVQAKTREGNSM